MNRPSARPLTLLLAATLLLGGGFTGSLAQEKKRSLKDVYAEGVKHFEAGEFSEALADFETFLKYQPNYPYARNYAAQCRQKIREGVKPQNDLEGALAQLNIPEIKFEEASLGIVFEFLSQKSQELSGGKTVANFIYKGTDEMKKNTPVTLNLRNTPFTEVIRYVGQVSGTIFTYEEFAIVATPAGQRGGSNVTSSDQDSTSLEAKFDSDRKSSLKSIPPANQDPFGSNR